MEQIVLGGGCFWCLDASFSLIKGVVDVTCGYAGGSKETADYYAVSEGNTAHAEVVRVTFNSTEIELHEVLDIFWAIHDPTTKNRQGNDVGPQYRSVIFYSDEAQRIIIDASVAGVQKIWNKPVVTEILPLEAFYEAEAYHQDYFAHNPEKGYCQVVINPKLKKLREKFASSIK